MLVFIGTLLTMSINQISNLMFMSVYPLSCSITIELLLFLLESSLDFVIKYYFVFTLIESKDFFTRNFYSI